MMRHSSLALALAAAGLFTAPAGAQGRGRNVQGIPPGHMPPPGHCRVWYDGQPPGRQPAPTNCEAARRVAARTAGRVIYGGGEQHDDRRRGGDERRDHDCVDRNRDGRCDDVGGGRPTGSLPDMLWGVQFTRGEHVDLARRWVGSGAVAPRVVDDDRNGVPEEVTWYVGERIVQRWVDTNFDGRADQVGYYENGQLVRVVR